MYIYDLFDCSPGIPRHNASKLMCWAIKLNTFLYVIEHLPGEDNVRQVMLMRWAVQPEIVINSKVSKIKSLNPCIGKKLDWPGTEEIKAVKDKLKENPQNHSRE